MFPRQSSSPIWSARVVKHIHPPVVLAAAVTLGLLTSGCGSSGEPSSDGGTRPADLCREPESFDPVRVPDLAAFEAAPDATHRVIVNLRAPSSSGLAPCDVAQSERGECVEGADVLLARFQGHQRHIECLLEAHGDLFGRELHRFWWYERLRRSEAQEPAPILLSFSVNILGRDVRALASHPTVAGVTLAPAQWPGNDECPTERESIEGKLVEDTTEDGAHFVIVSLRTPPLESPDCTDCPELTFAQRALHIVQSRRATCVQQSAHALARPLRILPHGSAGGSLGADRTLSYPLSFSVALTGPQARELAGHPYVEQVHVTDWGVPAEEMCPPSDLNGEVCPDEREPIDGKIIDRATLELDGEHDVIIQVTGGATPCPIECPGRPPCPAMDAAAAQWTADNLTSQRCVRAELEALSVAPDPDTTWLVNIITARLTWTQIAIIAAHPHVLTIEGSSEPPPGTHD